MSPPLLSRSSGKASRYFRILGKWQISAAPKSPSKGCDNLYFLCHRNGRLKLARLLSRPADESRRRQQSRRPEGGDGECRRPQPAGLRRARGNAVVRPGNDASPVAIGGRCSRKRRSPAFGPRSSGPERSTGSRREGPEAGDRPQSAPKKGPRTRRGPSVGRKRPKRAYGTTRQGGGTSCRTAQLCRPAGKNQTKNFKPLNQLKWPWLARPSAYRRYR